MTEKENARGRIVVLREAGEKVLALVYRRRDRRLLRVFCGSLGFVLAHLRARDLVPQLSKDSPHNLAGVSTVDDDPDRILGPLSRE